MPRRHGPLFLPSKQEKPLCGPVCPIQGGVASVPQPGRGRGVLGPCARRFAPTANRLRLGDDPGPKPGPEHSVARGDLGGRKKCGIKSGGHGAPLARLTPPRNAGRGGVWRGSYFGPWGHAGGLILNKPHKVRRLPGPWRGYRETGGAVCPETPSNSRCGSLRRRSGL